MLCDLCKHLMENDKWQLLPNDYRVPFYVAPVNDFVWKKGMENKKLFNRDVPILKSFFWASCRIRTNDPEITNHVLWPTELKRQVGKLSTSRRYDLLPLLRSSPGGFTGSWPYRTYPAAKVDIFSYSARGLSLFFVYGIWKRLTLNELKCV